MVWASSEASKVRSLFFDRLASLGSSHRTVAKENERSGLVHCVAQTEGIREIERGSVRIYEVEGKIPRELV